VEQLRWKAEMQFTVRSIPRTSSGHPVSGKRLCSPVSELFAEMRIWKMREWCDYTESRVALLNAAVSCLSCLFWPSSDQTGNLARSITFDVIPSGKSAAESARLENVGRSKPQRKWKTRKTGGKCRSGVDMESRSALPRGLLRAVVHTTNLMTSV